MRLRKIPEATARAEERLRAVAALVSLIGMFEGLLTLPNLMTRLAIAWFHAFVGLIQPCGGMH